MKPPEVHEILNLETINAYMLNPKSGAVKPPEVYEIPNPQTSESRAQILNLETINAYMLNPKSDTLIPKLYMSD